MEAFVIIVMNTKNPPNTISKQPTMDTLHDSLSCSSDFFHYCRFHFYKAASIFLVRAQRESIVLLKGMWM